MLLPPPERRPIDSLLALTSAGGSQGAQAMHKLSEHKNTQVLCFPLLKRLPIKNMDGQKPLLSRRILASLPAHENIYTLPNILTFSRLIASPIIGYMIVHEQYTAALALFVYAGATDLVDGWIARKWNLQTVVGTVIDPMADKTLMTVLTVSLAMQGAMPLPLAALILGRDILLSLAAIYYRYISLPPPKTLARYWDFSLPSAEVHPTGISKVNTALQLGLIGWTMSTMAVGGDLGWWGPEGAMKVMWYVLPVQF
ncbi:MAG: hypothetical protein Q9218_002109 [Villophora microphyllina]